jgi:hypothetical protein
MIIKIRQPDPSIALAQARAAVNAERDRRQTDPEIIAIMDAMGIGKLSGRDT